MNDEKLIQIIGYRSFIHASTGKPALRQHLFEEVTVTSTLALLNNLEKIVSLIPEKERYDLHYTNAECLTPSSATPKRTFYRQDSIPIDLDGINLEKKQEYIDIVLKVLKIDREKTGIYCSGNGLHLVVVLEDYFDLKGLHDLQPYYKEACKQINLEIFNSGLIGQADSVRLSESSTLRLPLTENRKDTNNPKQTYIIQGNVERQALDLKSLFTVSIEESKELKEFPTDTPAVLSGCDFLKWCLENPNKVSEPQWYAMIGVLAFIPHIGESLCHTYSKAALNYDETTTQNKFEQARALAKPRICSGIDALWNQCSECPYYNKVKTPLQIKSEDFISTQATGFHNIIAATDGKVKYNPNYEDLVKYFGSKTPFITNVDTKLLMKYNGKYWDMVDDLEIQAFATKHFNPVASIKMRAEFVSLLKTKNVSVKNFVGKDNNNYINFANGVLDLKNKELIPHSMEFGFTYALPYDYNPNAKCPNFDLMMDNITLRDEALKRVMLEFIGYAISGRPNSWIQKVMVLTGEGSNGKSTFMNIVRRLVGEDCYSAMSIASMGKENNRFTMYGKLFNISFDEDPKALLKGGVNIFKAITAGDPVDFRQLYSNAVSAPINAKLIVSCNKPLETNDHTHAVYRRMLIIPFRAKFEGTSDVKEIHETIYPEMSGIYNAVLEGLTRLIANKGVFSQSKVVDDALTEYKYESAVFQRFFDDVFEITDNESDFIANDLISSEFTTWKERNNEKFDISTLKLIKELKSLNLIKGRSDTRRLPDGVKRGYLGIKKTDTRF